MTEVAHDQRRQLLDDGYCVVEDVLPNALLAELRDDSARLADERLADDRVSQRSTGSMINVFELSRCVDLVTLPAALETLKQLGYEAPKFTSGYVISKPPDSPQLFWHYDWACWDDPGAFGPVPQQLFLMYYLVDTTRENGCLRVIPGSHRSNNPLHDLLAEAHSSQLAAAKDLDRPEFGTRPDEVNVPVKAGDVVIGDSRVLHASHANTTDTRRTVITLWYHPDVAALDEGTQGFIAELALPFPDSWGAEERSRMAPLVPRYDGKKAALPWNRHRPATTRRG